MRRRKPRHTCPFGDREIGVAAGRTERTDGVDTGGGQTPDQRRKGRLVDTIFSDGVRGKALRPENMSEIAY